MRTSHFYLGFTFIVATEISLFPTHGILLEKKQSHSPVLLSGTFTSKIQLEHSLELQKAREVIIVGLERGDQISSSSYQSDCFDIDLLLEKYNERFNRRVKTKLKRSSAYILWQDQARKKRSFEKLSSSFFGYSYSSEVSAALQMLATQQNIQHDTDSKNIKLLKNPLERK